jgi:hypothetical protein
MQIPIYLKEKEVFAMAKKQNTPKDSLHKGQSKDKHLVVIYIRSIVEKATGKSLSELKQMYSEEKLFFEALRYITTTKKAICEAMQIPIEAACRYKRNLEDLGILVESADNFRCPFTGEEAKLLSTNPKEFERLKISKTDNQLKMFDDGK